MPDKVTIFICSDFHAQDGKQKEYLDKRVSFFDTSAAENSLPTKQLLDYIERENLQADISLFGGDLSDKAYPAAAKVAWTAFHDISKKLGASVIAGTTGNHDLDSRNIYNHYDPKGFLQTLDPKFPLSDEGKFNEYWARHACLLEHLSSRILLINSAAYHGYLEAEDAYGRISPYTMEYIKEKLEGSATKPINILVVHHPPAEQSFKSQGEGDFIKNGDELINLLDAGNYGEWLIVYGHKHFPRLSYAQGAGLSPIMLSSASLSAVPYSEYGPDGVNQVHFIEFNLPDIDGKGLCGIVKTLDWTASKGWKASEAGRGLPSIAGFGCRLHPKALASLIIPKLDRTKTWADLKEEIEELKYITTELEISTVAHLRDKYNVKILELDFARGIRQLQL